MTDHVPQSRGEFLADAAGKFDVPEGTRAPGSVQWRWYCNRCGEPLRVASLTSHDGGPSMLLCDDCDPHRPPSGQPNIAVNRQEKRDEW